jgi:hypothetical protein
MVEHVACMGRRGIVIVLMGKPESERPVRKSRCEWVDNIKIYLREIGWSGSIWDKIGTCNEHTVKCRYSLVTEQLVASKLGLNTMELVNFFFG